MAHVRVIKEKQTANRARWARASTCESESRAPTKSIVTQSLICGGLGNGEAVVFLDLTCQLLPHSLKQRIDVSLDKILDD
jgi:hypothetical protein